VPNRSLESERRRVSIGRRCDADPIGFGAPPGAGPAGS
jgi:hypothetical protein